MKGMGHCQSHQMEVALSLQKMKLMRSLKKLKKSVKIKKKAKTNKQDELLVQNPLAPSPLWNTCHKNGLG